MRLAVIGFGVMGERIVRAALDHPDPDVALSGVWDPALQAMERLSGALPTARHHATLDGAIAEADCVYIASPPTTHLGIARQALAAGKAIFTEKPLGVDLADSRAFVRETQDARAAVNFIFASSPAVAQLEAWLAEGVIGRPRSLSIETDFAKWPRGWQMGAVSWLGKRAEGGFTREVVSHFLFLTGRLVGETAILDAHADFPPGGLAETAIEAALLAGDVPVTLTGGVGTTDKDDHNLWLLEGDAGAIRLSDWSTAERRLPDGSWAPAPDAMPHAKARPLILRGQLTKLADMTAGKPHTLATPAEALAAQELVEAILATGGG